MIYEVDNVSIHQPISRLVCEINNCTSVHVNHLKLIEPNVNILFQVLSQCTHIRSLNFSFNHIPNFEATKLVKILSQSTQLTTLSFVKNTFDVESTLLTELAKVMPQLCHLVQFWYIKNHEYIDSKFIELIKGLLKCTQLKGLYLYDALLSDTEAIELAKGLPHCTHLTFLNIEKNSISNIGATELSKALPLCPRLEYLNASQNNISDYGAIELAKVLPHCYQLVSINLSDNDITDKGVKLLVNILPKSYILNKGLIWNNLDGSNFYWQKLIDSVIESNIERKERAKFVALSFYHNENLTRLFYNLNNNTISKQDFIDFRFWEKNNSFWFNAIRTKDEKIKTTLSKKISNYIDEHYLQITEVVKNTDTIKKNDPDSKEIGLHDLPLEILSKIYSNIQLEDVYSRC